MISAYFLGVYAGSIGEGISSEEGTNKPSSAISAGGDIRVVWVMLRLDQGAAISDHKVYFLYSTTGSCSVAMLRETMASAGSVSLRLIG